MSGSPSVSFSVGGGGRAGMLDATAAVADAGAVVPLSRGTPPVTKYRHPLSSPVATAHSHSLPALSASDPGTSGAVTAGTSLGHGTGGSELPMADRRTTDIDSSSASVVSSHFSLHSGSRGGFRNPSDGGSAAGRSTGRRHHSHSHRVSGKRDGPGPPGSHYLSLPDEDGSHGTSERADFDILDLPAEWMDPITHTLMMDPVRLADGCLCDRSSAAAWYARGHINNPRSGDILYDATLVPDDALRSQIHGLLETNPRIVQQSMQLYHRRFMEHAVRLREEDIASMFSKSHFGKRVHAGDGFWKAFDSPDFRRDQRGILADDVAAQLNAGDAHHGHHTGRSRHSSGAGGRSTSESSRGRHSGDPASERLTGGRTGHSGGGLGRGASRGSKRGASKIKRAAATRPMNEIEKAKSALSMSEDVRSFLSRLQCLMYEKTFTEVSASVSAGRADSDSARVCALILSEQALIDSYRHLASGASRLL